VEAVDPVLLDQLQQTEQAAPGSVRNNPHLAPFISHLNKGDAPVNCIYHTRQPGSVYQKKERAGGAFALYNPTSDQYLRATGVDGGGWKTVQATQEPATLQHSFGGNLNILMWECEQVDGSIAYMTFHGSYITIDATKDPTLATGLTWSSDPGEFSTIVPDFKPFWAHWPGLETGQFVLGAHIVIE